LNHGPVLLRPATYEDHSEWAALREASREHLTSWEPAWNPEDVKERSFRQRVRHYGQLLQSGVGVPLLVFRRSDGVLLGGVSLSNIRYGASRSAAIGYWIGSAFSRNGFGKAAVSALVEYAFDGLGLNRIDAACQPENLASRRLLASVGFRQEGFAQDYLKINGVWRDHLLFAVTARDRSRTNSA
jgi:ribosomal-protein-alanine N-acetyltransferase